MAIAFLFSGQGAQKVGMGRSLTQSSAAAQEKFETADRVLDFSLSQLCFEGAPEKLTPTSVCQPALYVHGLAAIAAYAERLGPPDIACTAGLSLGELTALHLAGVFSFEDGLRVVAERGRLMQEACEGSAGGMVSLIGGTPKAAFDLAREHDLDVANLNCPGQIVLSGDLARIDSATAAAKGAGFKMAAKLDVAGAYHSRLMQPAAEAFAHFLSGIDFADPQVPVYSNVTGQPHTTAAEIKRLLVEQVTSPVRWEDCLRACLTHNPQALYECGPGNVIAGHMKRIDRDVSVKPLGEFGDLPSA